MKNDIIGTFGVLILGGLFLFFAQNYNGGEYWAYDLSQIQQLIRVANGEPGASLSARLSGGGVGGAPENEISNSGENEGAENGNGADGRMDEAMNNGDGGMTSGEKGQPAGQLITAAVEAEEIKPEKTSDPLPYLTQQLQGEFGQENDLYSTVGEYFLWPARRKGEVNKNVTAAQGIVLEQQYEPSGRSVAKVRSVVTARLRKVGYKKVKYQAAPCQVANLGAMTVCLDFYERNQNEKCMSVQIMSPFDQRDGQKVEAQIMQIKVLCGRAM